MKIRYIFFTFFLVFFVLPALGMAPKKDLDESKVSKEQLEAAAKAEKAKAVTVAKKIVTHDFNASLPKDMKEILDAHDDELREKLKDEDKIGLFIGQFPWLPNWWVKEHDPKRPRIAGAIKYATIINEEQIKRLRIPKKYFYCSPSKLEFVITQHIKKTTANPKYSVNEASDLYRFIVACMKCKNIQQVDIPKRNIIKQTENKLFFIDTEDISFEEEFDDYSESAKNQVLAHPLTPEARKFIQGLPQ